MPPGISTSDFYYILPELVITAGALLVLIADVALPRSSRGVLSWITMAVIGATLLSLTPFIDTRVEVANGLLAVDRFALFFKILFLVAAALTVLMSTRYLEVEGASPGEYYFLILCATLGMMVMAGGIDLITIFIGLETMAISFYILAGFIKPNQRSNEAAVKYFLLGAFSLGILLYGMSIMYGLSGTTGLRAMAPILAGFSGEERDPRLVLAVILVVAGVGFKIAAVPFHMWAPDVYEGAPTPITAFLSVGSKAASFAMLVRIFIEGLPASSADWRLLFWMLAIVTMTVGNLAALTQTNIKRMLAYSSIAHAGYLLMGVVAGTSRGISAMLIYLLIYAFMQLGAFTVIVMLRRRDVDRRRAERLQRARVPAAIRRLCDAGVHAFAWRHTADSGLHGQVLAVRSGDRIGVRVARGDRRAEQCHLALLLHPAGRLHVSEARDDRIRADHHPGAGVCAHGGRGGHDRARHLSPFPLRGGRGIGSDAGRGQRRVERAAVGRPRARRL